MDDREILAHINDLVDEEHRLEREHAGGGMESAEADRLKAIEVALDQCWDLLRQRRARRSAGADPAAAHERPEAVVEHYQQ